MKGRALLIVCPDYISHLNPLLAVAEEWKLRGGKVTVASGQGVARAVKRYGFDHVKLVLGPGSSEAVLDPSQHSARQADHMAEFFEATRRGPVATLMYQSRARLHDMLYEPDGVHSALKRIVSDVRPDVVVVDQLSYSATLALHALDIPFVSFHPGHPAGVPTDGMPFGYPREIPAALPVQHSGITALYKVCQDTQVSFTKQFNSVLSRLNPEKPPVADAFAFTSPWLTLMNYPEVLLPSGTRVPARAEFLGSCIRPEPVEGSFASELGSLPLDRPTVYVSFGTMLSTRVDVVDRVASALQGLCVNVILASGVTDPARWGGDSGWIVKREIPQLAAIRASNLVISHGGNNTFTEALTAGVPLLIGPFSSDQFDNAAAAETAGVGRVFAPNEVQPGRFASMVQSMLEDRALQERVDRIASELQTRPGAKRAVEHLLLHCDSAEQVSPSFHDISFVGTEPAPGSSAGVCK